MGLSRSFFANKNTIISILFVFIFSCNSQNNGLSDAAEDDLNDKNSSTSPVPANYELIRQDDFGFFDKTNWSKGLIHDTDESIRMIWNKNTGGEHLLNDNYDGYLVDNNAYVSDGLLFLENRKEKIQGTDPVGQFDYTTGWINSLQKINFNGVLFKDELSALHCNKSKEINVFAAFRRQNLHFQKFETPIRV